MKTLLFKAFCFILISSCHSSAYDGDKQAGTFSDYYNQYQDNTERANLYAEDQVNDSILAQSQVRLINEKDLE